MAEWTHREGELGLSINLSSLFCKRSLIRRIPTNLLDPRNSETTTDSRCTSRLFTWHSQCIFVYHRSLLFHFILCLLFHNSVSSCDNTNSTHFHTHTVHAHAYKGSRIQRHEMPLISATRPLKSMIICKLDDGLLFIFIAYIAHAYNMYACA